MTSGHRGSARRAAAAGWRPACSVQVDSGGGMRVLVTGAAGQLAQALVVEFRSRGHEVHAMSRRDLDVTRCDDVLSAVAAIRPAAILNASAYNAVDGAELDADAAFDVNASGPMYLAAAAERCGA